MSMENQKSRFPKQLTIGNHLSYYGKYFDVVADNCRRSIEHAIIAQAGSKMLIVARQDLNLNLLGLHDCKNIVAGYISRTHKAFHYS